MSAGVSSACLKIEDDISKISEFISNPLLCKNTSKKDTQKNHTIRSKKDPNKIKGCYPLIQQNPEVKTPSFHGVSFSPEPPEARACANARHAGRPPRSSGAAFGSSSAKSVWHTEALVILWTFCMIFKFDIWFDIWVFPKIGVPPNHPF